MGISFTQLAAQGGPTLVQMELDRALGDAQGGGGFGDGQSIDVEQGKRQSLLTGETLEHRGHLVELRCLLSALGLGGEALDHAALARIRTVLVAKLVDGHPPDPSDGIVVVHDRTPAQMCLHERMLHGVGGCLLVAAGHRERANESPVVGAKQRFEVVDNASVVHQGNRHHSGHARRARKVWLTANVQCNAMPLRRLASLPRASLATLPTHLEPGPLLPGGANLWMKRDDLTGLGVGGNKARKLEFLCGQAQSEGAECLITVGAGQSNHCRMTAAAGARLGMETHLVLSGDAPDTLVGNQALAHLFGAHLHFTGVPSSHWGALEIAREALTDELAADGLRPHSIPIGGSTAVGALGYVVAFVEIMQQCEAMGFVPTAIVFTSSSGGTHAGLVAGKALWRGLGNAVPDVLAIGVAKGVVMGLPDVADLANEALALLGESGVEHTDVEIDIRWLGEDYAIPSAAGDDAIRWAARQGGWVLDRTYSGKGFSGLLGNAAEGRWGVDDNVVFIHTGGLPAVFVPGGLPA